jgi:hypothetical protein
MTARAAPWTTALLAVLCAGLSAAVVLELTGGLSVAPEVTAAPPKETQLDWSHEPLEFEPPSRDALDEIEARPLFSASRRPFVAAEEEVTQTPVGPLPSLELIGVLLTERQRAALMQPAGGKPSWVLEGSDLQGWYIEKIERSRVHLRSDDRLDTVELRSDTAVPAEARPKPRAARKDQPGEESDEAAPSPSEPDQAEADPPEEKSD